MSNALMELAQLPSTSAVQSLSATLPLDISFVLAANV
jgi:hypothetical protein